MTFISKFHQLHRSERGSSTSARVALARQLEKASHILRDAPEYHCSVCDRTGKFLSEGFGPFTRPAAVCPHCGARERHRLQALALDAVIRDELSGRPRVLHAAPEPLVAKKLKSIADSYLSIDLDPTRAERVEDLTKLSFTDSTFDLVFASHVLEHIPEDRQAIAEIWRVLAPGGIAILPVPIVAPQTVEYSQPVLAEAGHVRAPGLDYFDRLRHQFESLRIFKSQDFDPSHQLVDLTDRNMWGKGLAEFRPSANIRQSPDYVPVCRKKKERV